MAWDAGGHVIGHIVYGPRLVTVASGAVVANFTVEAKPRAYDKDSGEMREVTPVRIRCNAWHGMGTHVANSLHRGDRVLVIGRWKNNDYVDDKSGKEKSLVELEVDAVGPDLRYAEIKVLD